MTAQHYPSHESVIQLRAIQSKDTLFLTEMVYEASGLGERPAFMGLEEAFETTNIGRYTKNLGQKGDAGFIAVDASGVELGAAIYRSTIERGSDEILAHPRFHMVPELVIALRVQARGRRLGGLLLDRLVAHAKGNEIAEIALTVSRDNMNARRLYTGRGFRILAIGETYYGDDGPYESHVMLAHLKCYTEGEQRRGFTNQGAP